MSLHIVDHPLIRHKLGLLRKDATSTNEFRSLTREVACALAYEASRDLATERKSVKGWAGSVEVDYLSGKAVTLMPLLRGGLGMLDGVLDMIPGAKVSMLGLDRDEETGAPVEYYRRLARHLEQRTAFILDPVLASGANLKAAVSVLLAEGCTDIRSLHLIAAPEGIDEMQAAYPSVQIYTVCVDKGLDAQGFVIPGLGNASDRIFGTR
ncbi:MAG: uracil phosphoribosyltransferase [Mailhella sp.]|nr:uracil phosphoribosyltransferase [Mailhella sp.]